MFAFLARLREPSTLAGLSTLGLLVGAKSDTVQAVNIAVPHVIDGLTALLGLGAVFMREARAAK